MAISLSPTRTHLLRDDRPFFWLADTAWNGVLKAAEQEWRTYLQTRAAQGFTAIQFVCTQWRAYDEEAAFTVDGGLRLHDDFFARRDLLVRMIRDHGLVPAPVLLWALTDTDPGKYLSEDNAVTVARYIADRWGDDDTVFILGGDGHYDGDFAPRWQRIGRRVFADRPGAIVTMHPCGQTWVVSEFRHEPWFSFHGYQSGHGDSEADLRWLLEGPPGQPWQTEPVHPVINLEPNYETHPAYQSRRRFTDDHVRRAAYWSLLVTPTAGVTYGNNAIWWWGREPEIPLGHEGLGIFDPWHTGLDLPGVRNMTVLRSFFESLAWWTLRPAPQMLAAQPGEQDPARHIMLAANAERTLAVAYLPRGGALSLQAPLADLPRRWFDPRTGDYRAADSLTAPDEQDWVLLLQA